MRNSHPVFRLLLAIFLVTSLQAPAAMTSVAQDSATIHYHRPDGAYDGWGLHVWADAAQETLWAEPLAPAGSDDFGLYWEVPLRAGAQELGFIIHKGDEKDPGPDQFLDLRSSREAWIVSRFPDVFTQPVNPEDLPTGEPVTEEPAGPPAEGPASVSFPGDYAPVLGGEAWQPADAAVQGSDEDGTGVWTLRATLPGGDYEFKVAVNGTWAENYGRGGVPDGPNIAFSVPDAGGDVLFTYDRNRGEIRATISPPSGPVPAIPAAPGDGQFVRAAVRHDSRNDAYRRPGGAQPFGTDVTLRLRTAANDVEAVSLVVGNLADGSGFSRPMTKAPSDGRYDWWETTFNNGDQPAVWNYHFQLFDGAASLVYADNGRRDGGTGQAYDAIPAPDQGWDIYTYMPGFDAPDWAKNAVIYQIFPDRFRNGDADNDPTADDWFYPEECGGHARPVTPWNTIVPDPEPADPGRNPEWAGTYNCTFYGGDIQGVLEKLDYLQELGVTTIYFNPIFDSPSNHRYDGRDYRQVDENLGVAGDFAATNELFRAFAAEVHKRGMHLILDGVPNHSSSDSPFFDKYGTQSTVGACESEESPYRDWYFFDPARPAGSGECAGGVNYRGWAGVSTLPQLNTGNEEVIDNWLGEEGIAVQWLQTPGIDGWRIDVVPDVVLVNPQFFELFRTAARDANPEALLISETWSERDARLRVLGDEFDSTMNYRFRLAVLGFLRDYDFTEDGDGGVPALTASEFEAALRAVQEDYPPAAFATAMNLLSSHDVNRAVRVLDHDGIDYAAQEPANGFADGRARLALAAVLQFTLPGAPTVYYGDEAGLVGFGSDIPRDDPYNRQPYPWADAAGYDSLPAWRQQDADLLAHFQRLGQLRSQYSFLRTGSWDTLLVDDAGLYVFGRKDENGAAIIAVNRSAAGQQIELDLSGYLPYKTVLTDPLGSAETQVDGAGMLTYTVPAFGFQIWVTGAGYNPFQPSTPPFEVEEGNGQVTLQIQGDDTAARFAIYRSLVDGGYQRVAIIGGTDTFTEFVDEGLANGVTYYYRVAAIGYDGLESEAGATRSATPHVAIGSVTVGDPAVMQHTVSAVEPSPETRGVISISGLTDEPGQAPGVLAQVGWAPAGTADFTWVDGTYDTDNQGGADVYVARMLPEAAGEYVFKWRASVTGGREWIESDSEGKLTVFANPDTEAPKPPFRLDEVFRSGSQVVIGIRVSRAPDLYGFRVCRADLTAGEEGCVARTDIPKETSIYTDSAVTTGHTYVYTVVSVDNAFNVSEPSKPLTLTAELALVDVAWRVLVPAETPADAEVFIAGDDASVFGAPYNPGLQPMTPAGDNLWEWSATVTEGTQLQYKYTRGDWERVEQWGAISGFGNRQVSIVKGADGTMLIEDTATDWGAEGPDDHRAIQAWRDPLVAQVEPAPGGSGPAPEALAVVFSIQVTPVGNDLSRVITVVDEDGTAVPGAVAQTSGTTFTFTPDQPFSAGTYTVTVFAVEQTTPMVEPYTWSFSVTG
ncbi:MAG: alpha amylase N-terminal ig-like domain-containing protein [Caldilineaceae bacterium]|nr:alpha amylase N-terminal ig-like domain-containing protein [Caldilineaceae bacterium]